MLNKVWVVIPAAGVGARMQADRPKQYLPLVGKTVIEHTLACFAEHPAVAGIVVAITDGDPYWAELTAITLSEQGTIHTAPGGLERADSVLNGLDFLLNTLRVTADTPVLVHDAARPCLSRHDLDTLLAAGMTEAAGAILAVSVRDTMKRAQAAVARRVPHHVQLLVSRVRGTVSRHPGAGGDRCARDRGDRGWDARPRHA